MFLDKRNRYEAWLVRHSPHCHVPLLSAFDLMISGVILQPFWDHEGKAKKVTETQTWNH